MRILAAISVLVAAGLLAHKAFSQEPPLVCISPEEADALNRRIDLLNMRLVNNELKMSGLFLQYIDAHHHESEK